MEPSIVSVRIRGRGETTVNAEPRRSRQNGGNGEDGGGSSSEEGSQSYGKGRRGKFIYLTGAILVIAQHACLSKPWSQLNNAETVENFKKRIFKNEIAAGKKCRLIARGKELQDANMLGTYNIEDGSCLHVVVVDAGSTLRLSQPAEATSREAGRQTREGQAGGGPGFAILCTITLGMIVTAWALFVVRPELFSPGATFLLFLLTGVQFALFLAALKNALVACRLPFSDSRSHPPRRRRQ